MEWESCKQRLITCILKYRYILLILLAGVMLLLFPDQYEKPVPILQEEAPQMNLQSQLENILGKISGVGEVHVLLTEATGADTIYQMDEDRDRLNLDTVIVTNSQREEIGLIKKTISPEYRGAMIVCQGGDQASVRLAIINAVKSVTGLSSDCIAVLKMK